jgi:cytochrome subunit of sulfide dehydrogenase
MWIIKHHNIVLICAVALSITTACTTSPANNATSPVDKHARNMAASCAGCHGVNGYSAGGMPPLAGMEKSVFVTTMKGFKSGALVSTVMGKHAKGFNDEEIELLGHFFAAQAKPASK